MIDAALRSGGAAIATQVAVTDPGQLGAGSVPAAHAAAAGGVPDPRRVAPTPDENPLQPTYKRNLRLRGGMVDPYVYVDQPQRGGGDQVAPNLGGAVGPAGAPDKPNVPEEHERPAKRASWWPFGRRRFHPKVQPATGAIFPGDDVQGDRIPSTAALGDDNQFVVPDVRRAWSAAGGPTAITGRRAGYPLSPIAMDSSPSAVYSHPMDVDIVNAETPPDRPRAGEALPDQGRPAHVPRWFYSRPFDQWATHNFTGGRSVFGPPRVSTPLRTTAEVTDYGAGYHVVTPAPGMDPIGPKPNTWRLTPQPWDQNLVDTGVSSQPSASSDAGIRQAAGVRARGFR